MGGVCQRMLSNQVEEGFGEPPIYVANAVLDVRQARELSEEKNNADMMNDAINQHGRQTKNNDKASSIIADDEVNQSLHMDAAAVVVLQDAGQVTINLLFCFSVP